MRKFKIKKEKYTTTLASLIITLERLQMMNSKKYKVYDTTGSWLKTFNTYQQAFTFCLIMGRRDWLILKQ